MKFISTILAVLMCVFSLASCGNLREVEVISCSSDIYTDVEIDSAIDAAIRYFRRHFDGCTLTKIGYAGDEENAKYIQFAERNNADEVIVLVSTFDVGASGGDSSLNPNSTYTRWKWILVRNNGGSWIHVDHGY